MLLVPPSAFGLQVPIRGIVPVYARTGSVNPDKGARGEIPMELVAKMGEHEIPVSHPNDFRLMENNNWFVMIGDSCYQIHPECEYARIMGGLLDAPPPPPTDLRSEKGNLADDFQETLRAIPKILYHAPSKRDEAIIKSGKIPLKPARFLRKHSDRGEGMANIAFGNEKSESGEVDMKFGSARIVEFSAFCMSKTPDGAEWERNDRSVYEINTKKFSACVLKSLEKTQFAGFTYPHDGLPYNGKGFVLAPYLREVEYYDERDVNQAGVQNFGQRKDSQFASEQEVRLILIVRPKIPPTDVPLVPTGFPLVPIDFASCCAELHRRKNK